MRIPKSTQTLWLRAILSMCIIYSIVPPPNLAPRPIGADMDHLFEAFLACPLWPLGTPKVVPPPVVANMARANVLGG